MSLRTIMIFPEFKNMEIIDEIRKKYDPLANLVRPHITLVFPFESKMSNEELAEVLKVRLKEIKPFAVELQGISKQKDTYGNYLFLDVVKGAEEICAIHQILYENEFKKFDLGYSYVPHMTLGKLSTVQQMEEAYKDVRNVRDSFDAVVNKIFVEMIGEKEESIIVIEKNLNNN